jgi:hypothetical protein
VAEQASDDPEAQAAVAAEDERGAATRQGLVDAICYLPGYVHDEGQVLLLRVLGVRTEGDGGQVAKIGYIQPLRPQPLQQAGGAESGGPSFLSRSPRAGAGRDADKCQTFREEESFISFRHSM